MTVILVTYFSDYQMELLVCLSASKLNIAWNQGFQVCYAALNWLVVSHQVANSEFYKREKFLPVSIFSSISSPRGDNIQCNLRFNTGRKYAYTVKFSWCFSQYSLSFNFNKNLGIIFTKLYFQEFCQNHLPLLVV